MAQAVARELLEETGVQAEAALAFAAMDAFDRDPDGTIREQYILVAVLCHWRQGEPVAGDDALEAAWHDLNVLDDNLLVTSFGVRAIMRQAIALVAELEAIQG